MPDIAKSLEELHSEVESTLSIYLFGFDFGVLFFGIISDKLGRKPCIIAGLFLFVIGSFGCYLSNNIEFLIISRFVQAFGASIGSVLGQAICRDAFHGKDLIRVYSIRMITSNSLAMALVDYKYAIGSAYSLFGFFYYVVISFLTFFMSCLHNGTLIVMPLYFLSISVFMLFMKKLLLKH